MSDSNKDLGPVPQHEEIDFLERQRNRTLVEGSLVHELTSLISDPDPGYVKYQKGTLERNLERYTYDWQVGYKTPEGTMNTSGTIGEIVSRWVGIGILEDFPEFSDTNPITRVTPEDSVKIEPDVSKENNKYKVQVVVIFPIEESEWSPKYKYATWSFNLDREVLEKRWKDCEAERLKYQDQIWKIRDLEKPKV